MFNKIIISKISNLKIHIFLQKLTIIIIIIDFISMLPAFLYPNIWKIKIVPEYFFNNKIFEFLSYVRLGSGIYKNQFVMFIYSLFIIEINIYNIFNYKKILSKNYKILSLIFIFFNTIINFINIITAMVR